MATKETVTIAVRDVLTATKPVNKTIPFDNQSQNSKTNNWTIRTYITLKRTKNISVSCK